MKYKIKYNGCSGFTEVRPRYSDDKYQFICANGITFRIRNKSDGEFIACAVNSHEALLEALKLAVEKLKKIDSCLQQRKYKAASLYISWGDQEKAIEQAEATVTPS